MVILFTCMIPHSVFGLIVKVDEKMLGGEGALVSIISDCIKDERSVRICILSNSHQATNPPSCRKFLSFYGRLLPSLGKQTKSRKPPVTQYFGLASWNFNLKAWKFDIDMYLNIFYLLRFLNHLEVLDVKIWDEQLKFNCQNSGEKCNS